MIMAGVSEVRLGVFALGDHYLNLMTGRLAEEEHTIDQETGRSCITYLEDVHSLPDQYLLLPHISHACMRKEYLHRRQWMLAEEDLRHYEISIEEEFDEYYQYSDTKTCDRATCFIEKTYHLFEKYRIEEAYKDYAERRQKELFEKWCEKNKIQLIEDDPQMVRDRFMSWSKTTTKDFEIVKKTEEYAKLLKWHQEIQGIQKGDDIGK